ncbi:androgen-induced protein 1-related [Anaeramoeba flamelloides]|uniref:Androgen-induced protein 1-related n=1 Tax=Anaeramoeba flamelloides TaxID=1746091 RepID=A0AAV7Z2V8_9EUKA|nr:androgen-induced protein 1-related [Anaeramoeba flamelloides]
MNFKVLPSLLFELTISCWLFYIHTSLFKLGLSIGAYCKYLTQWNLVLSHLYFCFSSIIGLKNFFSSKKIEKQKPNTALTTLFGTVLITSTVVTFIFWGVYHYNRDLIFPESLEQIIGKVINHSQHTLPLVALVVEWFIFPRQIQIVPKKKHFALSIVLIEISYLAVLLYYGKLEGKPVYPFIGEMNNLQFVLMVLGIVIFSMISVFLIIKFLKLKDPTKADKAINKQETTNKKKKLKKNN